MSHALEDARRRKLARPLYLELYTRWASRSSLA